MSIINFSVALLSLKSNQIKFYLLSLFVLLIQITRSFHRHQSTIQNLIDKYRRTGSVVHIRRRPRRRVTSRRQDRHIVVFHLRYRFHNATATARVNVGYHNRAISSQTVRNRLREVELRLKVHEKYLNWQSDTV